MGLKLVQADVSQWKLSVQQRKADLRKWLLDN
jgi:hypothetical protein